MFKEYLTKTGRISTKQPRYIKTWWYISRAQEVHGNKYQYDKFEYLGATIKSIITCKIHGDFTQTPNNHISNKQGCPHCQGKTIGMTEFLLRAEQAHGNRYDYTKSVFKGMKSKINIQCKVHGEYTQVAYDHVSGHGCAKCAGNYKLTNQQVVQQFVQVHKNSYDYSEVDYVNDATKVKIICREHGVFLQTPRHHKDGHGCPSCQDRHNQDTLYVLKDQASGLVKIGVTNNLPRRIGEIGLDVETLLAVKVAQPRILEQKLHQKFSKHRVTNHSQASGITEFFQLTPESINQLLNSLKEHY